jgi:phosphatidylinositol glycan class T
MSQKLTAGDLLRDVEYMPSVPPTPSTTTLHLHLTLLARSTLRLSIPFTKLTLKYAERGREIPPGVLTLLDVEGEDGEGEGDMDYRRSSRRRVYAAKLLLDVPTPDFSMPYNVIIMTSTVMAVFFGSLQGRLVRRWGWVETEPSEEPAVDQTPETERLFPPGEKVSYDIFEEDLNANDTDSDADPEEAG